MDSDTSGVDQPTSLPRDRSAFQAKDIVEELWTGLGLPPAALASLSLPNDDDNTPSLPSSFKIGTLAQATIALSALAAAQVLAFRRRGKEEDEEGKEEKKATTSAVPHVTVARKAATIEFQSERLYMLDGKPAPLAWGPLSGLYPTADGYVRIHDGFPNHREGTLDLLGLPRTTTARAAVSAKTRAWAAVDLENVALDNKLCIYALRSYSQWDRLPQARALPDLPVTLRQIAPPGRPAGLPARLLGGGGGGPDRCLRGLRVLEMSRVIAAPLAGKTLAAHGADVLWVTSPTLPDLPVLDCDLGRGKRTIQLDARELAGRATLLRLAASCDVFLQGFRPGSVASLAGDGTLAPEALAAANPGGIVVANLSAFGPRGPWAGRRGFDSLVQTCTGMNVSEAEHYCYGDLEAQGAIPARPTPCQVLDHAAGYLLAAGIAAALSRRARDGGSYCVDVSLAGVMKYLRSLGQYPGKTGFAVPGRAPEEDVYFEEKPSGFGRLRAVRHSAQVEGFAPGWDIMPKPLGSDTPEWLE